MKPNEDMSFIVEEIIFKTFGMQKSQDKKNG